ncbi:MAG: ABC transporter substrate-binding protein, partial [Porticoccaceae bacterium]|nr:ABC transporter substrate-binding protein [Porticoccaceae bacterium]
TNESHRKVAVAIQQMWNKYLNIEIKLLNQEWKVYLDSESAGQYTISRASWIGDYVDPNSFLDLFLCNGGNNRTGWCNAEYDRLILDVAPKMKSHEERLAVFQEAETLLLDAMPMIPIYIYTSKHLMNSSVKNHNGNLLDQTTFKELTLESDSSDSTGGNH